MKIFIVLMLLLVSSYSGVIAQSISISPYGSPPDSSAMLDIQSTTKGLLIPRMTQVQRDNILLPATGLTIFQTDETPGMYYYDGLVWKSVSNLSTGGNWLLNGDDMSNDNAGNIGIGTPIPTAKLNIRGSVDTTQLIIDANIIQGNDHPLIKLRRSDGVDLMWIHSDQGTNTFIGLYAGKVNNHLNGGTNNTFMGSYAGASNTNGYGNTAHGAAALYANTKGSNNTASGLWALSSNTTASQNTAIGKDALYSQSFSNGNTEWNSDNVAVGYAALTSNTPTSSANGIDNTAVGSYALTSNTIGWDNTAIGTSSLYSNTTGIENTALGRQSLFYNTYGFDNTATGYKALRNNETGALNTADGAYALLNSTGAASTAIGYESLFLNTTGYSNTGIGCYALHSTTTGNGNTAIGFNAGNSSEETSNSTALGSYTTVNISQKVRIGSSSINIIEGQVAFSWPSDGRFKENVRDDVKGLDFILKLQPVSYNFNRLMYARHIHEPLDPDREKTLIDQSKNRSVGFIAQDVEKVIRQTGFTSFDAVHAPVNETDNYSMGYAEFVVPLVKSVQELNEKLISQNDMLIKRIDKLELLVEAMNKK